MLHPSSLVRLAVYGGIAFLVRAIVRESRDVRGGAQLLPPPRGQDGKARAERRPRSRRAGAA